MEISSETINLETKSLLNDINYGVILSFIDKFGKFLALKEFVFDNFESSLINQTQITQYLQDFFWCLIRNTSFGKNLKKDKIEFALNKVFLTLGQVTLNYICINKFIQKNFANSFMFKDFCFLDLKTKLKFIQTLVESQFDENPRFKQFINENSDDGTGLRLKSVGKDINGSEFWFYTDSYFNVRLFSQYSIDVEGYSWQLVAKNVQQIRDLIDNLVQEPSLKKLNESKRYQKNLNPKSKKKSLRKRKKLVSESEDELNCLETGNGINENEFEENDEDSRCIKCSEIKENYMLIICDSCDFKFHLDCLKPHIEEIPDGDWYCPICEHSFLIKNLQSKLDQIELDKKEAEERKIKQLKKDEENHLKKLEKEKRLLEEKFEDTFSSLETFDKDTRSRRVKSKIKYTFEEFDKQIKEATGINNEESDQEDRDSVESFRIIDNSESIISDDEKENSEFSTYEIDIKKNFLSYDESESESNEIIRKYDKNKKFVKNKKKITREVTSPDETDMEQSHRLENRMKKFRIFRNNFKRVIHQSDDDNEYTAYNEDDYFNQNLDQQQF